MKKLKSDNNIEVEEESINIEDILENATQSQAKDITRSISKAGVLSIVNAKTGSRLVFSNKLLEKIDNPEVLQVSYDIDAGKIIIGEDLENHNDYILRKNGRKGVIYCKALVEEIPEALKLDFNSRTSLTFDTVEYLEDDEDQIAVIEVEG